MKHLTLAPHRAYFFFGALSFLVLFAWWAWQVQHQHYQNIPLHALLMPLGFFPLFILGFTFTAGPRWLSVENQNQAFVAYASIYTAGMLIVIFAHSYGLTPLRSAGFALMLSCWSRVSWRWFYLVKSSRVFDKQHAHGLLLGMIGGIAALIAVTAWSLGRNEAWVWAKNLSLYAFLLPIFLSVCHRMLPFFSGSSIPDYQSWRPYPLLHAWLFACYALALSLSLNLSIFSGLIAAALSISCAYTSWRWGLLRCWHNRLLAMLHAAFAWLSVVFALLALAEFAAVSPALATHALGLGFMGTMLVAFVSRVSYGHSGRVLQAGNGLWAIYLGLHLATALRLAATAFNQTLLMNLAAITWLVLILLWVVQMLPIYLKPRQDGQAG